MIATFERNICNNLSKKATYSKDMHELSNIENVMKDYKHKIIITMYVIHLVTKCTDLALSVDGF